MMERAFFQALWGMLGGVHMDVHPAASVHDSPRMAQGADNLLQLSHFAVFQLGGIHLHLVGAIALWEAAAARSDEKHGCWSRRQTATFCPRCL